MSDIETTIIKEIKDKIISKAEEKIKYELLNFVESSRKNLEARLENVVFYLINTRIGSILKDNSEIKTIPLVVEYITLSENSEKISEKEAEIQIIDSYKKLGFRCERTLEGSNWLNNKKWNIRDVPFLDVKKIIDNYEKGIPDLIVWNKEKYFFVEVKMIDGHMSMIQLQWYYNHTNTPIIIVVVR